jgi:hypothetical protein
VFTTVGSFAFTTGLGAVAGTFPADVIPLGFVVDVHVEVLPPGPDVLEYILWLTTTPFFKTPILLAASLLADARC